MPKTPTSPVEYRALVGLNYGPTGKRVEAMEIVTDLPPESVEWLVEQRMVRLVADEAPEPAPDALPVDPEPLADPLLLDGDNDAVIAADLGGEV